MPYKHELMERNPIKIIIRMRVSLLKIMILEEILMNMLRVLKMSFVTMISHAMSK